ncbi:fructose-bisphosphate aldolase class I [Patescibacteria group bacterium]|nr:MAG: fructose-bisphosphate aldolase class I [Patescibacteria group bacterium]
MSLNEIAKKLVAPGKGILAADESTGTIGKRFAKINVESTEETRRQYRELLFTAPAMEQNISGVILYDETIRQSTGEGVPFPKVLESKGVIPGIKVDAGLKPFNNPEKETLTSGLDGLDERLKEYYALGARFAKWRAALVIGENLPTAECLRANAERMAKYAKLCQENNVVPIVEPEVLMNGGHDIARCYEVTKNVLKIFFEELGKEGVALDGILLKPNMVISGEEAPKAAPQEIAGMTIKCFKEVVPTEVPGIVFLSGGQSEQEACENLNAINLASVGCPWQLSYSYGRALQASALRAWSGELENVPAAQQAFVKRAKLCGAARDGKYNSTME